MKARIASETHIMSIIVLTTDFKTRLKEKEQSCYDDQPDDDSGNHDLLHEHHLLLVFSLTLHRKT
jgi:hypothetical protein